MNSPTHFRKLEVMVVSLLCLCVPIVSDTYLSPLMGWAVTAALMVIYLFFLGRWISGTVLGVLINERNLMSLSRFQMVAWTVLVLSAFFTIALKRLHVLSSNPNALPLAIGMDWHLWTLMGISATSLVGSPLILSTKTVDTPAQELLIKRPKLSMNLPMTYRGIARALYIPTRMYPMRV